ncbi:MAG: potassium/proton antiporter [Candidatus Omnitrophica bacterium]|nr:potassium/proton antiporter [Candidatus Omnitrophota bacterium]
MTIEANLLWVSVLMLVSVFASKITDRFAIPALLLFLTIGMLAGSEGIGGVYFDDPWVAKSIGVISLIFIIFSGGIDTNWKEIRPILLPGIVLSTAGVLLTAVIIGLFSVYVLKFSILEGLLLGSIVSSTDAAAVFSILRSKRISLKSPIKPLLEMESGSNDPMAVFLTITFLGMITTKDINLSMMAFRFFMDMAGGAFIGYIMGRLIILIMNRLNLEYDGLYPVLTISFLLFTYTIAVMANGNGFLAVYIIGLMMGKTEFLNKKLIIKFHDGLAWLSQIVMFLTMGLLVFPSHVIPVMATGILISVVLMIIARPISVLLCLLPFRINAAKKAMVAWVGLRGAVPIILATFPLLAGIPQAETIFNVVFFVVITSVLIQGISIPYVSKVLNANAPFVNRRRYPIDFEKMHGIDAELTDVLVPYSSDAIGKRIAELAVPEKCLIMLVSRGDRFIIPSGQTVLEEGDVLLVLANDRDLSFLQESLKPVKKENR